jgi:general secretion pathway protein H
MPISATGMLSSDAASRRFMREKGEKGSEPFFSGKRALTPFLLNGKGFTLIELLVVVVIIGLLTSLIAISISPNQPSPQRESRRFYQVLEAAREQAVLFNQELGVELRGNSYRVLQWQAQRWRPLDTDLFSEYGLPENLSQTLWLGGLAQEGGAAGSDRPQPQILLFSTGEVTPFGWTLGDPAFNDQWRLSANALGEFDLKPEPVR